MKDQNKYHKTIIDEFAPFSEYYDEYVHQGKEVNNTTMTYNAVISLIELVKQNKVLQTDMSVLDLGTGTALFAQSLKDIEPKIHITGLDLTPKMLEKAAEKDILDKILCADLTKELPFKDNSFEMTSISSVFEFLSGFYQHTIDEMLRVTKPNGVLAISAKKSDELNIHDYLNNSNNSLVIAYKESAGYVVTKNGKSESTPYEFILARVTPT